MSAKYLEVQLKVTGFFSAFSCKKISLSTQGIQISHSPLLDASLVPIMSLVCPDSHRLYMFFVSHLDRTFLFCFSLAFYHRG